MEENSDKIAKVEALFQNVPQPFRESAIKFATNIVLDDKLNEQIKNYRIQDLMKKVTAIVAYVANLQRNLGKIGDAIKEYASMTPINSKSERIGDIKEYIESTQMFLAKTDNEINEIISDLDTERAKELIEETELRISALNSYAPQFKKCIKKTSPKFKVPKKFVLPPKIKKALAGLGLSSLMALSSYAVTGVAHSLKEGNMIEDYQVEENVKKIDDNTLIKLCMQLNESERVTGDEAEEFKNKITQIAKDMDDFIKKEQKIKDSNNKPTSDDRLKYHQSAAKVLEYSELQPMLQNLIKAKLAISINQSQGTNVGVDNITIGRHVAENEDNKEYNYITYQNPKTGETITNKETIFCIGLFDKDTNGRMQAEFVDIVDIYRKLSEPTLNEEELAECYKSVMAFIGEREIQVSRDGRFSIKDNKTNTVVTDNDKKSDEGR